MRNNVIPFPQPRLLATIGDARMPNSALAQRLLKIAGAQIAVAYRDMFIELERAALGPQEADFYRIITGTIYIKLTHDYMHPDDLAEEARP